MTMASPSHSPDRDVEKQTVGDDDHSPTVEEPVEEVEDYASSTGRSVHNDHRPRLGKTTSNTSRNSALSRQSSIISTVRSRNPAQTNPFTHRLAHVSTGPDVLVDFDGPDDPYRPLNWPFKKKAITTALYGFTTMGSTLASSIYSAGTQQIAEEFSVSNEVSILGISLLLLGFGVGPLIWAPLSEVYGRKNAVLMPYFIAAIFSFATATSKDIQTVMITRFFTGFFGSAPVTNTGGVLGDLWSAEQRGMALVFYAFAVVGGPLLGPIIGGAICQNASWRWVEYLTGIFMLAVLALDLLMIDESYAPVLLLYKARRLRVSTQNWALHASHEEWDVSLKELGHKYMIRPFQMLSTPICFLVAIYASFVYGILYANLSAYPIEFQEIRGWNQIVGALPFLALLVGVITGGLLNLLNQKYYYKKWLANDKRAVPEARLPPMMGGSVAFAAGLFVFAWTSDPAIHWFPSQVGAWLVGIGFFCIFQAALNYLVDTFTRYGASAIAANTFLRSCFGAAFPLFIGPELRNLGVAWGISVFAFVSVVMIPIPYFFFVYGRRIRARGFWSRESL